MERMSTDKLFSKSDLDKAYIDGLECAIFVLEKSISLSYEGQKEMIKSLKELVDKRRTDSVMNRL